LDEVNFCLEEAEKRIEASKILLSEGYYKDAVSRAYYSMYYASNFKGVAFDERDPNKDTRRFSIKNWRIGDKRSNRKRITVKF
jgi:hypothetical protein